MSTSKSCLNSWGISNPPMKAIAIFAIAVIAFSFLIVGAMQSASNIPVCRWHSMECSPESADLNAATQRTVAEEQAAENWTLAGLHCPQGGM